MLQSPDRTRLLGTQVPPAHPEMITLHRRPGALRQPGHGMTDVRGGDGRTQEVLFRLSRQAKR